MAATTQPTEQQLTDALRTRGQRVTSQRLVIHRALRELGRHVTADELLDVVRERLPGVSLPTIYSTLDLFEELAIVRRVSGAPGAGLYDPRPDEHSHLVCRSCGRVEDVEVHADVAAARAGARKRGFSPERTELVVRGLCAACA